MRRGLTLVELLAVIAIAGVLASIAFAGYGDMRTRQATVQCTLRMRNLSQAVLLYAADNGGKFPQSSHSGSSWAAAIATCLGEPQLANPLDYRARPSFVCPAHAVAPLSSQWSYGLNVFFELSAQLRYTPAGLPILGSRDNYAGSPATWSQLGDVPFPSRTILLAENPHALADHFMAHQWSSLAAARNAVASDRHSGKANYAFVDGRVEALPVEKTFNPNEGINLWNPSLAH